MTMRFKIRAAVILLCTVVLVGTSVHAQVDFGVSISLSTTPEYPRPGDTVRITAESTLLDFGRGDLVWYVNGVERATARNVPQIEVEAGSLGATTRIKVVFFEEGFERASAEAVVRPTEIDLLWESDSYTPPFFRGRALPSAGTTLRMEALTRFQRSDGTLVPPDAIEYTWRNNNYVIAGASGRGKYRAALEGPSLFETDTITVEARSLDGRFSARKSVTISSIEPLLTLYENHPIFGILYHQALDKRPSFEGDEVSLTAVPYFADARSPDSDALQYEWRVNGNKIANDPERPSTITINASGSSGAASIDLLVSHISNLFFRAENSWGITLSASSVGGGLNSPFGGGQ